MPRKIYRPTRVRGNTGRDGFTIAFWTGMAVTFLAQTSSQAQSEPESSYDLRGQASARFTSSQVGRSTLYSSKDGSTDWFTDSSNDFRFLLEAETGKRTSLEIHYEIVLASGDLREAQNDLADQFSGEQSRILFNRAGSSDESRLFDLTKNIHQGQRSLVQHRVDRFNWTWTPDWGSLIVGREAVTWGNGMVFNPMDLFNPFSPSDIEREYKMGDDLLLLQVNGLNADTQIILVPRRDAASGKLGAEASSLGLKHHLTGSKNEFDFLVARHYEEIVGGMGVNGYLGQAVWRADVVALLPDEGESSLSAVVNLDYSWVWSGKNNYGLIELYYNSDGFSGNYENALKNERLMSLMERGEVFTLGRRYLSGSWQVELHPLLKVFSTAIVNLDDLSSQFIPRLVWEPLQNLQIHVGGNIFLGSGNTEFGGVEIPVDERRIRTKLPRSAFLWAKWYF